MSQVKKLNPKEIVDFNIDYYDILNVNCEELKKYNLEMLVDRQRYTELLEKAFRKQILKGGWHPDNGGSNEKFKLLVRAHTILADPLLKLYYDTKGEKTIRQAEDSTGDFGIDWDKLGLYREGTTASIVGQNLFRYIYKHENKFNLIPSFYPQDNSHSYQWDFIVKDSDYKLTLSLINDENQILRLSSGKNIQEMMPFSFNVCIPRGHLYYIREPSIKAEDEIIPGKIKQAIYKDIILFETVFLKEVEEYIDNILLKDLDDLLSGALQEKQKIIDETESNMCFKSSEEISQKEREFYASVLLKQRQSISKFNRRDESVLEFLNK